MFDSIRCLAPLPLPQFQDHWFQTKDTPLQGLDRYEIRGDGTLWFEDYDIEDRSDPKAEGIVRIFGMFTRVNKRWVLAPSIGTCEVRFYNSLGDQHTGWIEFSAYFVEGKLNQINLVEHREPNPEEEILLKKRYEEWTREIAFEQLPRYKQLFIRLSRYLKSKFGSTSPRAS